MTKHTPGPWVALIHPETKRRAAAAMVATQDSGGKLAIDVTGSTGTHEGDAANARLIAAAPELYEALRAIVDREADEPLLEPSYVAAARAALAKVDDHA